MKILILNGPNLDLIGFRDPQVYGNRSLKDIEGAIRLWLEERGNPAEVEFLQSNSEGILIDKINSSHETCDAIIINPGALAHYSLALGDSLCAFPHPKVEVHLSNPLARGDFRKVLVTSACVDALVLGMGADGYTIAMDFILRRLASGNK